MKKQLGLIIIPFMIISCTGIEQINISGNNIQAKASANIESKIDSKVEGTINEKSGLVSGSPTNSQVKEVNIKTEVKKMLVGEELSLFGIVTYQDGSLNNDIIWTSNNKSVAIVEGNILKALSAGKVDLTASANQKREIKKTISMEISPKILSTPLPFQTSTPIPSPIQTSTPSSTSTPSPEPTSQPLCELGSSTNIGGSVYDKEGKPITGAMVTVTVINEGVNIIRPCTNLKSVSTETINGAYGFDKLVAGVLVEIKVSKAGWSTRKEVTVFRSNLPGDPTVNRFDFGGEKNKASNLQEEPQVDLIQVNKVNIGTRVLKSNETSMYPSKNDNVSSAKIDPSSLTLDLTFTEPVKDNSVQTNFRMYSELPELGRLEKDFILTEKDFNWSWSSDKTSVNIKPKTTLPNLKSGVELRYLVTFDQPFVDFSDTKAISNATFRFGTIGLSSYFIFSVKGI